MKFEDVVTPTGKLRVSVIQEAMEEDSNDVMPLIAQMYEMIWSLASDIAGEHTGINADPKLHVDGAAEDITNSARPLCAPGPSVRKSSKLGSRR